MRTVLIYRSDILPLSETFIRAQANALERYWPQFIGLRETVPNLLSAESSVICERSCILPTALQPAAYQAFGVRPAFHTNQFMRRLRMLAPSLIHAHFATDARAALPLAEALGVPLVVTLHGYDVTVSQKGRNPLRRWQEAKQLQRLWTRTSVFLCVSDFIRQQAITAGFPEGKLIVHHIGIDTQVFKPTDRLPLADEKKQSRDVVFIGRLTEKKGCSFLLQAMHLVQQRFPQTRLILLGDGPLRGELENLATELRVDCFFLGRQPHQQVVETLSGAHVCAIPSVTAKNGDSEGLPMILAEAQGLGVPVVATRHAGIPEGIVDGNAGLLSAERDVQGLAANIIRLLEDELFYEDVRWRGIGLVRREFELRHQTDRLEAIYDAVLAISR